MADDKLGTLDKLIQVIGDGFADLAEDFASPDDVWSLFWELGFAFPPALSSQPSFMQACAAAGATAGALVPLIQELATAVAADDVEAIAVAVAKIVAAIAQLLTAADEIASALGNVAGALGGSDGQNSAQFAAILSERLIGYLVIRLLEERAPLLESVLELLGLVSVSLQPLGPDPLPPKYLLRTLQLERFGDLVKSPATFLQTEYGWGAPTFDGELLLARLRRLLQILGLPVVYLQTTGQPSVLDLWMLTLKPRLDLSPRGLELALQTAIADGLTIPVASWGSNWALSLTLQGALDAQLVALVQPPAQVQLSPPSGTVDGQALLNLVGQAPSAGPPLSLLNLSAGTGLYANSVALSLGGGFAWDGANNRAAGEIELDGKVQKGQIVIKSSDPDSFIAKLLPEDGLTINFDFALGWSSAKGFYFSGGAGIETTLALDLTLGPIDIESLHVAIYLSTGGAQLELSTTASGQVGPISASIDRLGVTADLKFQRGSLGPVDLAVAFKPPSGLGISVDAGPISGGGYIYFDPPNGRYAGVLSLSLYSIQVTAIGLLDTKLPTGPGYSFLIIISVEFTPIQLGFGFTLNGVGGLCGINRDFVTDALQAGLRAHSLDHIMFPKDPIANAPAIISDLRTIFPPAEGRYVFGPMVELGWGGGLNLVTAELGILVALPSPVVIAILGQLNVNLPNPAAPVVELHLDVLGILDFGKKLFSLDATLHDSRIVVFTIYGDMAMRLSWGDNPSFALSVGGLNPHFQPPDNFPQLKRLTIALSASSALKLSIQSYFAITSNSFQFGAKCELYAGVSAFNVYGWLGFDALFIFNPFSFVVDFTAGLAFRSNTTTLMGISVDGELSGPTPWNVKGNAHVSILFFSISVHVNFTWGDKKKAVPPQVDAWLQLKAAVQNVQNWSGSLPAGIPTPVTLSTPKADATQIYVDPNGVLTMRQRVLPFNQTLTKFGEAVPGPQTTFKLDQVTLGNSPPPPNPPSPPGFSLILDKFAPAQFEQMSDQDKLSRPSFDDGVAGFTVGDGQLSFGQQFGLDITYADIYVDDRATLLKLFFSPTLLQQLAWAQSNGAFRSGLKLAALSKFAPPQTAKPLVTFGAEQFVITTIDDLTQRTDITIAVSKGEAYRALATHLANNPSEQGQLQVVPLHELAA